ncbi:ABC transporter related protein [Desulfovibrio sp. X2]|uniref:energy-coupling factor ABC transporter ATP-binding protein n=1 Tax=Desulfovibrio sp. X2 TaxID=941449 RepID=UPI000358AB2F|nr:ABC transporter ATP-binding protein [Desulfovibrio sp. X2]EPR37325.1 ABC transporter related protein [Desulfovibrio sp. X2]
MSPVATSTPVYSLRGIEHEYKGRPSLRLPSLDVPAGTILGLCGPNGCGKSTLLRVMAFLLRPTHGEVTFAGRPADDFPALRREVTLLLQRPVLLRRSVFDNVAYGMRVRGLRRNLAERVSESLCAVGLDPAVFARRSWRELSGGEAQRVAMAARLAIRPRVLLLDEPTSSLDPESAERITAAAKLARDGQQATVVVVSHDHAWLRGLCDSVLHLAPPHAQHEAPTMPTEGNDISEERP